MKNFVFLFILCSSFLFSCSGDDNITPEVEICYPESDSYDISFTAINHIDGDLLDPDYHFNMLERISIEYKGNKYKPLSKSGKVRDDIPIPFKISLTKEEGKNYHLNFGAFNVNENYQDETFLIDWMDMEEDIIPYTYKDTIVFSLYQTQENGQSVIHKELFVNGKPNPGKDEPFLINKLIPTRIIYDFVNYSLLFEVTNKDGENLLDPTVEGNILNKITVHHRGKKYNEIVHDMDHFTRATYVYPLGIRLFRKDNPILAFGEFSPTENYRGEIVKIEWGDGTSDWIEFNLYINWEKGEPVVYTKVYLNYILCSESFFDIIKIVK